MGIQQPPKLLSQEDPDGLNGTPFSILSRHPMNCIFLPCFACPSRCRFDLLKVSAANIVLKCTHNWLVHASLQSLCPLGPLCWIFFIKDGVYPPLSSKATPRFYIFLSTKGQEVWLYITPVLSVFQGSWERTCCYSWALGAGFCWTIFKSGQ